MNEAAERGATSAIKRLRPPNLDNGISQTEVVDMPCVGGESIMASEKNAYYSYLDINGNMQTIRIYGKNNKEMDMKFQQFIMEPQSKPTPTVKEFVEDTYKPSYYPSLHPTTVNNYEQYLTLNILPFMGDKPMNEVGVDTIQQFSNWMATAASRGRKKNINEPSIRRIIGLVKRIFTIAFEMRIVDDVPVKKTLIKIKAERGTHHIPLTDSEIEYVRAKIPTLESETERLYMAMLAFTGMRLEEIMGVRWEDIHLKERYISVQRAVTYPDKNKPHVDTTKSEHSDRTIIISSSLASILEPMMKDVGYVIGGSKPLPYSTKERVFARAKKKLNIVGYNNHDFRTTFATQLCEMGLTSKETAGLLGHADTRMVENVYARARHSGNMKHLIVIDEIMSKKSVHPGEIQVSPTQETSMVLGYNKSEKSV